MGTHGYAAPEYIMTGIDTTIQNISIVSRTSATYDCSYVKDREQLHSNAVDVASIMFVKTPKP
jgi:hypothetical protein